MSKRHNKLLFSSAVAVLFAALLSGASLQASLLPSFEGPHADIFGFQPTASGAVYTANNPSSGFSWVQSIAATGSVGSSSSPAYAWQFTSQQTTLTSCSRLSTLSANLQRCTSVQVTTNDPYLTQSNSFSSSQVATINYWVKNPNNASQWIQIFGKVVLYQWQLTASVQSGSDPNQEFKGDVVWLRFSSPTFNNYQFNPVAASGYHNGTLIGAWSAPLLLVLQSGNDLVTQQTGGSATNDNTIPDYHNSNAPQVLYSSPMATTQLPLSRAFSGAASGSALNATLAGTNPLSPDTQLSQYAYFPLVLSNVGPFSYSCVLAFCSTGYPSINLNFQVYYLQLGRYLWVNPIHKPLVTDPNASIPGALALLAGFGQWLQSPFGQFAAVLIILVIVVAVVVAGSSALKILR